MSASIADLIIARVTGLIAEHGLAVQGVFDPAAPDRCFTYTVGLTEHNLPELVLPLLDPRQAQSILNALADVALAVGPLPLGVDVDAEFSVPFRLRGPVEREAAGAFVAERIYGADAVTAMQVLWPDPDGAWPTEGCGWQPLLPLAP